MKSYLVSQNQTYVSEKELQCLWSPKKDKVGHVNHSYELMRDLMTGDVVYHLVRGNIVAKSVVLEPAISHKKPNSIDDNDRWDQDGWFVKLDMHEFLNPLRIKDIWQDMKTYIPDKYSAFQKDGRVNQSYLFPCSNFWSDIIENSLRTHSLKNLKGQDRNSVIELLDEIPQFKIGISESQRLEQEKRNKKTGNLAEEAVVSYYQAQLAGTKFVDMVEQVSVNSGKDGGHGIGFDVRAYEKNDEGNYDPIYVEVKGSRSERRDFFITRNEIEQALKFGEAYRIARVVNVGQDNQTIKIYRGFGGFKNVEELLEGKFESYKSKSYSVELNDDINL